MCHFVVYMLCTVLLPLLQQPSPFIIQSHYYHQYPISIFLIGLLVNPTIIVVFRLYKLDLLCISSRTCQHLGIRRFSILTMALFVSATVTGEI